MAKVSEQLDEVTRYAAAWMPDHQCPVADIQDQFTRMLRSFGTLAEMLNREAANPEGPDRQALDREVSGLISMLAKVLTSMSEQTRQ